MPKKPPTAAPLGGSKPEKKRATTKNRGYGVIHQRLREQLLAKYPVCVCCNNAFATQAHHLKYPAESFEDYLAVCGPCHSKLEREKNR